MKAMHPVLLLSMVTALGVSRGAEPQPARVDRLAGPPEAATRLVNRARVAEVSVSSQQASCPQANATDGDLATEWASTEGHPWIKLQWRGPVKIGRIVVCDRANPANRVQGGKLLFSNGNTLDIEDIPPGGAPCELRWDPVTVTWLRLDLFSARGTNPGLAEIAVYADGAAASRPAPAAESTSGTTVTILANDPRIVSVDGVREGQWCGAVWCPFAGTNVKLIGNTGPASGMADIYIDGIFQKRVDWYSDQETRDVMMFAATDIPDGKHLLGVLARQTKRPESRGTAIQWSRVEYLAGAHPERFVPVRRTRFDPNVPLWLDDAGEPLQCHMGGVMFHEGRYYLLGSDWRGKKLPGFPFDWCKNLGMVVYSSTDLMNWTRHANVCGASSDPGNPLYNYTIAAGRGKLLRAGGTGKFVALFEVVDAHFREINVTAAAVADKPEGPYRWHGILQLDGQSVQGADTAVFTDDDGKQYLVTGKHASDWNVADCLYELAPDCLSAVKATLLHTGGEAPALFKHEGVYYLLHSHLTGLNVNENFYHIATDIHGPWQAKGKIAQGDHSANTFQTQTTDVVPVAGRKGAFIWIGDSIRNNAQSTSRTVWLPVTIKDKGEMEIRWRDSWDLSVFDRPR